MKLDPTPLAGVLVATTEPKSRADISPLLFSAKEMSAVVGNRSIVQINYSMTNVTGAIRGFHFQHPPHAEMKMVRCLRGRVFDIAVDLRKDSPTFLRWHGEELSGDNGKTLVIPEGCAHGFQALEPLSELLYMHTHPYTPGSEGGVRHDDPALGVRWPLPAADLSERDKNHPLLTPDFKGLAP